MVTKTNKRYTTNILFKNRPIINIIKYVTKSLRPADYTLSRPGYSPVDIAVCSSNTLSVVVDKPNGTKLSLRFLRRGLEVQQCIVGCVCVGLVIGSASAVTEGHRKDGQLHQTLILKVTDEATGIPYRC